MKIKKRILSSLLAGILCLCAVGALAACGKKDNSQTTEQGEIEKAEIVMNDENCFAFKADSSASGEKSVYDYLVAFQSEGKMTFDGSKGDYGFFISSFQGKAMEGNTFVAVYTSLTEKEGAIYSNAEWGTYLLNDTLLASASYGVESLPVFAGETYALAPSTY